MAATESSSAATPPTGSQARLIVRFKPAAPSVRARALSVKANAADMATITQSRAQGLGLRTGLTLSGGRAIDERTQLVGASANDVKKLVQRLSQDAEVEWVAVDQRRKRYALPNDPLFLQGPPSVGPASGQWYLKAPSAGIGGEIVSSIDAVGAWNHNTGSAGIVVAVIDSGVRFDHPDLVGKLLPGYDMIGEALIANDGNGRDNDASDPGDWISQADVSNHPVTFKDCDIGNSSWHGTQVAGLVGATANNQIGMAGVAWGSKILPVRVLGKCGGYDSDIVAGMKWALGLAVPGLPVNPNPARVLNLSLGGAGSCDPNLNSVANLYREAIDAATAKNAVVVVAAGNSTGRALNLPANCSGAIGVVALRHVGTKVGFSDLGPEATIAAPGGNCVNVGPGDACLYPMLSTVNLGTTAPALNSYTDSYNIGVGTSFSAPLVSGTVALMLSQRPNLSSSEVITVLRGTARAFPSAPPNSTVPACVVPSATSSDQLECYCSADTCGAGMLDASAAMAAVAGVQARIAYTPSAPQVGQSIQLSGIGSQAGAGRSIKSYGWSVVDGGGVVSGFSSSTNASTATLASATAAGTLTVRLTVRDDLGMSASTDASIAVLAAPAPPPTATPAPSTGGGAFSLAWLSGLLLATLGLARSRRRRYSGET